MKIKCSICNNQKIVGQVQTDFEVFEYRCKNHLNQKEANNGSKKSKE